MEVIVKRVIYDLWHLHLIEDELPRGEREEQFIENVSNTDNALRGTLNKEQKSLLEEYDRAVCLLSCATEKHAFIKGAKFAVGFLFESLYED